MTQFSRRNIIKTGVAASALAASGIPLQAKPNKGGHLRVGLGGANTSDNWDGRTHSDIFMVSSGSGTVFDTLTRIEADGTLVGELAESWEASSNAQEWTFNLRRGVRFHNGKRFGADDVIESLNIHLLEGSKSAAKPILEPIKEMRKLSNNQVQFVLDRGNADLPFLFSDYHLLMYPAGQVEEAIAKGIGTGLYRVDSFRPGVRFVGSRVSDHYKGNSAGFFDSVEYIAINDTTARMNALMTDQVDAVNDVDFKLEALFRANPNVSLFEVTGNQHFTFPMRTDFDPYTNVNLRKALRYALKRQEMVDKILQGHGAIGNDHPIGPANQYYASDLKQNEYDPHQAKFYLKKAGYSHIKLKLSTSEGAFSGAVDAAQLYSASAKKVGIDIEVIREPSDGYWSNVWIKKPWCASYWSGRATEDWMFSSAYASGVPWNDTKWENARFQYLLVETRAELDPNKRRDMYHEMQAIMSREGGTIIPMYANFVGAKSRKLANTGVIGNVYKMDNGRLAERWWFA